MIKNKKIITCIVSFFCILILLTNFAYADIDTSAYSSIYTNNGSQTSIQKVGGYALGVVQTIGMAVATIMLLVLGIKYIWSSPDEKATIKDKAITYVIGAVIIFAASGLVGIVGRWATEAVK